MAEDGLEPEEGYFHPDFKEYAERELKWSRLDISVKPDDVGAVPCLLKYRCQGNRWVFWSRQDYDYPDHPLYHDNFVGSKSDACPSPEVRENIRLALRKMILDPCFIDTLVQFWAPTKTLEGRTLLTTQDQAFALGNSRECNDYGRSFSEYRMEMCREYNNCFYADAESGEEQLGVLGRVFLHKFPEFNDDVEYCSPKEYPQRDLALRCGIRGYWAVPVFERSSQTCVGVLEISFSYPVAFLYGYKQDFLRHVSDKFQEFGLQCFFRCEDQEMQDDDKDKDKDKNNALAVAFKELAFKELKKVLKYVCKYQGLPLAMTWVPCSTSNHLFRAKHLFQADPSEDEELEDDFPSREDVKYTLRTCYLRKEQVTRRIPTFPKLSYCSDVKQFSIAEYPLVTHVRHLKLSGCFTMCLLNNRTGREVYVLEFFLPPISKDDENIQTRLSLILRILRVVENRNFKPACSQEFGGGLAVDVIDFSNGQRSHSIQMIEATRFFPTLDPLEDGGGMLQLSQPDQPSMDAVNSQMNGVSEVRNYNLRSVEPLQNGEVVTQLDSSDQLSMDPANNGQDVVTAKRNETSLRILVQKKAKERRKK